MSKKPKKNPPLKKQKVTRENPKQEVASANFKGNRKFACRSKFVNTSEQNFAGSIHK